MNVFQPAFGGADTNAIAATTASQSRALPAGGGAHLIFYNDGPGLASIAVGDSTIGAALPVASAANGAAGTALIPVGMPIIFSGIRSTNPPTHWAAVSASTSNVYCTRGEGA